MVQGRKMTNYGPNQIRDFNTSFKRSLSKLSENQKIVEIGSMILKLWLLKDANYPPPLPPLNQSPYVPTQCYSIASTLNWISVMVPVINQGTQPQQMVIMFHNEHNVHCQGRPGWWAERR